MRLAKIKRGKGLRTKAMFAMIRVVSGHRAPDVVRALSYRPELWGQPFGTLTQAVMRGPSAWSVGERELFAAFVSDRNNCPF